MSIYLEYRLRAKFRAFGITFGTVEDQGAVPVGLARSGITLDSGWVCVAKTRGVELYVRLYAAERPGGE